MKKIIMTLMVLAVMTGVSAVASEGLLTDNGIEASGTIDYYSSYVWRGFVLDKDPVMQPGLSVSGYGATVSFWGSFDFGNNRDAFNSGETDFVVDYTKEFGDISVSVGDTHYAFPGSQTSGNEFYVGAGFAKLPLEPSVFYYVSPDEGSGKGSYLAVNGSLALGKASVGLHFGINNELFIAGSGSDIAVTLGTELVLTPKITCSPVIGYSMPMGDLESDTDGAQKSALYGGLSIGF